MSNLYIERIPWHFGSVAGVSADIAPMWRVIRRDGQMREIYAQGSLKAMLAWVDWMIIPTQAEINRAIMALGGLRAIDATKTTYRDPGPTHRLSIESNRITALARSTGQVFEWRGKVDGWKEIKA